MVALVEFRSALGLEESKTLSADGSVGELTTQHTSSNPNMDTPTQIDDDDESRDTVNDLTISGTSVAQKVSRGSSVESIS